MSASKTSTAALKPDEGAKLARMRREPTHPGEMLWHEFLQEGQILSQRQAAIRMGMSTNRLNEIVGGRRGVTPETAILFGRLTNTSPEMWLQLQSDFDLWHELQRMKNVKVEALAYA